jgi:hypothetical protein
LNLIAAAIIVAAAVMWAGRELLAELKAARDDAARTRALALLQTFSAGVAACHAEPRALLTWQPLARTARQLLPTEFAQLDAASGSTFPFSVEQLLSAHAQWTAEWLAWERAHDAEYKLRAAVLEHELAAAGESAVTRARLDAVEREKLDRYQRRYQEYVQVAKALQALSS